MSCSLSGKSIGREASPLISRKTSWLLRLFRNFINAVLIAIRMSHVENFDLPLNEIALIRSVEDVSAAISKSGSISIGVATENASSSRST